MSERKLVILGTAAQVPTVERNHCAYFLKWDEQGLLVDPGEGTQRQMTRFGIKASSITKILLTHFHGDHCLGLPGILQRMALDGVSHPVEIYFPADGRAFMDHLLGLSFHKGQIDCTLYPVKHDGEIHANKGFVILAARLAHPVTTFGYRLQESDGVTLVKEELDRHGLKGKQIGDLLRVGSIYANDKLIRLEEVSVSKKGQVVAFITDTSYCHAAVELAKHADLLLCESTYLSEHLSLAESYGHLTSSQAAQIAYSAGVDQLILSHFSQRYRSTERLLKEARQIHPKSSAAVDGDVYYLPARRRP